MAMSGIEVLEAAALKFETFKREKKHCAIIFEIKDCEDKKKVIDVHDLKPREHESNDAEEFMSIWQRLSRNNAYYIVWDFCTKKGEICNNRLLFTSWCPDGCSVKQKLMHAASMSAVKKMIKTELEEVRVDDLAEAESFKQSLIKARLPQQWLQQQQN